MSAPLRLAHYVSVSAVGGVERQFTAFTRAAGHKPGVRQTAVVCSKTVHPAHRTTLGALADRRYEKRVCGIDLPHHPNSLRAARQRWMARRQRADVALLWNRLGQQARVLDALGASRCLYWEHGSAWLYGEARAKRAVLARLPALICNSRAARRVLELQWDYQGRIRVCPNGVAAPPAGPRELAADRPPCLGLAARLVPVKAVCVALCALADLRANGVDARLDIAGDGPLRRGLEAQAAALDLGRAVRFLGVVDDMPAFFSRIDALLHTALREPFGMVAAEAQAAGVPVVCAAVDGLPEVVADCRTGRCVAPAGDLDRHAALGGYNPGLPPVVYDPDADCIRQPRVCEPRDLAAALAGVLADGAAYRRMSAAAIARMKRHFDFDRHVDDVLGAAREYAATGTLAARP